MCIEELDSKKFWLKQIGSYCKMNETYDVYDMIRLWQTRSMDEKDPQHRQCVNSLHFTKLLCTSLTLDFAKLVSRKWKEHSLLTAISPVVVAMLL
jgi:hypothetical protein